MRFQSFASLEESLASLVSLCELGVNPEALSNVLTCSLATLEKAPSATCAVSGDCHADSCVRPSPDGERL
eukprot:1273270-Amphidinium_carterae.3